MKKQNIKHRGVLYSAYSERGRAVLKEKRRNKSDLTFVPRSIMVASAIIPLATAVYA